MEEYYQQGDLERKLEFTSTPFFDRTVSNPFKYQLGYIDVVVLPLMTTWSAFKPVFLDELVTKGLLENKKFLESKFEDTKNLMKENQIS